MSPSPDPSRGEARPVRDEELCARCGDRTALDALGPDRLCPECVARREREGPARGRSLPLALGLLAVPFLINVPARLVIHGGLAGTRLSAMDILIKLGMPVFLVLAHAIRYVSGLNLPAHPLAIGLMLGWLAAAAMTTRRSDVVLIVGVILAASQTVIGLFMAGVIR